MNNLKSIFAKWVHGMAEVIFEDNTIKLKEAMSERIEAGLEEAAGELESQVKRNTRVDTGQTKNSWQHTVMAGQHIAYVGSPLENAIWEEFGTGEYALKGNGRKDGWSYRDEEGVWHHTMGKKPSRALHNAVTTKKAILIKIVADKLQGL